MAFAQPLTALLLIVICISSVRALCSFNMVTMTCVGVNITQFEEGRTANALYPTQEVSITKSELPTVPATMFDSGTNTWRLSLTSITMNSCQIKTVATYAFTYYVNTVTGYIPLPNLTHIDLSDNEIATYAAATFNLATLRSLHMQHNVLTSATVGVLLNQLEVLDLSFNQITELDPTVFTTMSNIRHLDLSENAGIEIPLGALQPLTNLTKLSLHNNSILGTYGMFTGLEKLRMLNISANRIPMKLLTPLENLEVLDFDHNVQVGLKDVAAARFYLPNLRHISIDGAVDWWCIELTDVVAELRMNGIEVRTNPKKTTLEPNVLGIACKV